MFKPLFHLFQLTELLSDYIRSARDIDGFCRRNINLLFFEERDHKLHSLSGKIVWKLNTRMSFKKIPPAHSQTIFFRILSAMQYTCINT